MKNYIIVKGQKYKVDLRNVEKYIIEGKEVVGTCNFKDKKIVVATDTFEQELNARIFHELIHAYLDECGLQTQSCDEQLVDWFAYAMPDIIKNFNEIKRKLKK